MKRGNDRELLVGLGERLNELPREQEHTLRMVSVARPPGVVALGPDTVLVENLVDQDGQLIAYAALDVGDGEVEIGALYVLPEHRGRGVGTALTLAAIAASDSPENLWICADDEDRPKQPYARLGFRPVITWTEFLRPPNQPSQ